METEILQAGTAAPDFTLPTEPDKKLKLSEFRGPPVILAFYPADWSPVCGDQLGLYNEVLSEFDRYGAQLIGISVDELVIEEETPILETAPQRPATGS